MEYSSEHRKIWAKALQLLARRMYGVQEIRKKLQRFFPEREDEIDHILNECIAQKYLDDELYAQTFVRFRQESAPRGKLFLKTELQKRGIAGEIIAKVLHGISDKNEQQSALELAKKKLSTLPIRLEKIKKLQRLQRFLLGRGFSGQIAFTAARDALDSQERTS